MFHHEKLFDFVVSHVIAEGGDGHFIIECIYVDLDKTIGEFEIWRKNSPAKNWGREDTGYSVIFSNEQEGITFKRRSDYGPPDCFYVAI